MVVVVLAMEALPSAVVYQVTPVIVVNTSIHVILFHLVSSVEHVLP